MRLHPILTLVWAAFFPVLSFGIEDTGLNQSVPISSCRPQEKSASYRRVLEMTDKDVQTECGLEKGAEFERCKSAVNHMRKSAQLAADARMTACHRVGVSTGMNPNTAQADLFTKSAEKTKVAEQGNLAEAHLHHKSLEDMREYKDQMLRRHESLLQDKHELLHLDSDTKEGQSVVSGASRTPASRAATIPEPAFDDYQVRPSPVPEYRSPRVIDASASGSRNLAEYEQKLPYMIERQERLLKLMEDFETDTRVKKAQNESTALELGKQASSLFLQAKQLGAAEESLDLPLQPGPKAGGLPPAAVAAAQKQEGIQSRLGRAELAAGGSAKAGLVLASLSSTALAAGGGETSEESAVLDTFQSRLMEDGKGKLSLPERSRLRDLLRRRAGKGRSRGESPVSGELVAEMLEEAQQGEEERGPASVVSKANDRRGIVRLDVQGAMEEIEAQLEEMDRSLGILSAESESLFERVKGVHRRSEKSGSVGRRES